MNEGFNIEIASIWKRIISACIDFILFILLLIVLGALAGESVKGKVEADGTVMQFGYSFNGSKNLLVPLLWLLTFPVLEGLTGYTLGKKLLRLKVLQKDGKKVSILSSLVRHLFDFIDFCFLFGFIIASKNKNRQRIGDLVANTIIIEENSNPKLNLSDE